MTPASTLYPDEWRAKPAWFFERLLLPYFFSGWCFFLPYLFLYLLYAKAGLPATARGAGPSLLQLYWLLHAAHLAGLLFVLFRVTRTREGWSGAGKYRSFAAISWLPLGAIFFLPGVYLEFPSDPWMHLARITEWTEISNIQNHSTAGKASYFLAYSIVGVWHGALFDAGLRLYYSAVSLLLCWQYFRLARAVGASDRMAFVFVLIQALLAGNSIFGFYRYYGLASTMIAEIAAMAFIRLCLTLIRPEIGKCVPFPPAVLSNGRGVIADSASNSARNEQPRAPLANVLSKTYGKLPLCVGLAGAALLIRYNHLQELVIAGLGFAAAVICRLIAWDKRTIGWLAAGTTVLSLVTIGWYRSPVIDAVFRPEHWLNGWYGFNLTSVDSPAFDRLIQIVGVFGLINFVAGLALLRKNHIAGWLTVIPVLALLSPCVAIPFATALDRYAGPSNIISFHRIFLGIPMGLAAVTFVSLAYDSLPEKTRLAIVRSGNDGRGNSWPMIGISSIALFILTTVPPTKPFFNRLWHAFMIPPRDLSFESLRSDFRQYANSPSYREDAILAGTSGTTFVLNTERFGRMANKGRTILGDQRWPSNDLDFVREVIGPTPNILVVAPPVAAAFTPYSIAGYLSGHWLPQEVPLTYSGTTELREMSVASGLKPIEPDGESTFFVRASPAKN